jgi:hypothetical protein
VFSLDSGWRLAFTSTEPIMYLQGVDSSPLESGEPLAEGVLEALASEGGVLASLFADEKGAVA